MEDIRYHLHMTFADSLPDKRIHFLFGRIISARYRYLSLPGNARIDGMAQLNLDRRPFSARYRGRRYVFSVINEVSLSPNHEGGGKYASGKFVGRLGGLCISSRSGLAM